jgi:hypothetical protein
MLAVSPRGVDVDLARLQTLLALTDLLTCDDQADRDELAALDLPAALDGLAPLMVMWVTGDDDERSERIAAAPDRELDALWQAVNPPTPARYCGRSARRSRTRSAPRTETTPPLADIATLAATRWRANDDMAAITPFLRPEPVRGRDIGAQGPIKVGRTATHDVVGATGTDDPWENWVSLGHSVSEDPTRQDPGTQQLHLAAEALLVGRPGRVLPVQSDGQL